MSWWLCRYKRYLTTQVNVKSKMNLLKNVHEVSSKVGNRYINNCC